MRKCESAEVRKCGSAIVRKCGGLWRRAGRITMILGKVVVALALFLVAMWILGGLMRTMRK